MARTETVTFVLPTGAKVTAPKPLAIKLGYTEPKPEPKPRITRKK